MNETPGIPTLHWKFCILQKKRKRKKRPTIWTKKTVCWICPIIIYDCASINTRVYAGSLNDCKTDLSLIPCPEKKETRMIYLWFSPIQYKQRLTGNIDLNSVKKNLNKTHFFSVLAISTSFLYHLIVESLTTLKNWHHSFTCPDVSAKVSLLILRITWGAEGNETQQ